MESKKTKKYKETLLLYYEEEIMGEAYFYGLAEYFSESEKLELLARVERCAANAVLPLIEKYSLIPRDESELKTLGEKWIKRHASFSWNELMGYVVKRYPGYLDDFDALRDMAPKEDLQVLKILTRHEVAAIEFAEKELAGNPDSLRPLYGYLRL